MTTIRVRLTLTYSGLFLLTSVVLLVTVNLLLYQALRTRIARLPVAPAAPPAPGTTAGRLPPRPPLPDLVDDVIGYQWEVTALTVGILTLVSLVVGWLVAGRILRPLHRITATAQRLSLSTLHERIALAGPEDELKELADTFDAMLDRLERSVAAQQRFIANASHELRTPLAVQRAAIEIGLPEDVGEIRSTLLLHNRRAESLIDALLVLAQAEHGLDGRSPVALDQVVRLAVAEGGSDGVTVTVRTEPFVVEGDPVLLNRLVTNLLDNAVRYNRPGGTVEVALSRGVLTVRNTGPHVLQEDLGDLFEPFRRLHTARGRGAGLGLSIVAAIAKAHGADVRANPNPGGGLELVVVFAGSGDAPPAGGDGGLTR
ncbi:HAMP domain-containing protein [Planomonospora sp. ID91781]|uniref:histidine kinase n=1 Tax=Planomonospora sphaerica TaxID=161355 RepID=A0A171BBL6_9ACTN|nr:MULTISPECIES: ATP-binding protein [Planomonospora]MBG0821990.1 HAMP domain-containing protein [Planomonospora sp. ID91781]GAT64885.1 two-component system sensor histidine kinase [Planomonospora sphaerica]